MQTRKYAFEVLMIHVPSGATFKSFELASSHEDAKQRMCDNFREAPELAEFWEYEVWGAEDCTGFNGCEHCRAARFAHREHNIAQAPVLKAWGK